MPIACAGCGFQSPEGMRFCGRCGTPLERNCPSCNATVPPDFLFCGHCGTQLDAPASATSSVSGSGAAPTPTPTAQPTPPGPLAAPAHREQRRSERRNVTVLFADLSGFTSLAEQLDPEELTALLQEYFRELRAEVLARDGWLAKYIGDALLAVFGAPVAHEDDPVRAVRTAIGMQVRIRELNRRIGQRYGQPLQIHIGINTGLVVAGPSVDGTEDGATNSDFTVLGDAVNVAARLQQVAAAGQIMVGESTYRETRWAFEYRQLPPNKVKGKREELTVYECQGPRAQPLSARGIEGIQTPLLGRDAELHELLERLTACRDGQPQIISLAGDAGIGKSRVVREFLRQLHERDLLPGEQVAIAYAVGDRPEPFGVARQLVAALLKHEGIENSASQLWQLLAPGAYDDYEQLRYLDPEHRQRRLYMLTHQLLVAHTQREPLLVIIEDLHWADESSVELIRRLVERSAATRLMFLLVHRPEWGSPASWEAPTPVHTLALRPLPDAIMRQLLQSYFGESAAYFPAGLVDMLLQRSGGNPFYLEELVRSLIQRGILERHESWHLHLPPDQLSVPDSLQGLLLARIDRLDDGTRLLLQEAAMLGQHFPARLLSAFTSLGEQYDRALRELVDGKWLQRLAGLGNEETSFRFRTTLVREVAYQSLLVRTRSALHRRAAELIEQLYASELEARLAELGEHYYRARDEQNGCRYLELTGDQAQAIFANQEASSAYSKALELLAEEHQDQRARLLTKLGAALHAQGQLDSAIERWQQAMSWRQAQGDTGQVIELHRRIAHALWSRGQIAEAQGHLALGLGQLEGQPGSREGAALYAELATQALHRGDLHHAVQSSQQALALAQQLAAYEQASLAATTLGIALARSGEVERGQQSVEQALRIATEHNLPAAASRAAANLAVLYANVDPLRAAEICEWGLAQAERIGDIAIQPWFYATLSGSLHACASAYQPARRTAEVAIQLDRQLGLRSHLPIPLIVLGQIHQCHGNAVEAEVSYQEALALAEELADPQLLFPCLEGLGTLYLELGDNARAQPYLERAQQVCESAGFTRQEMVLLPFLF